MISKINNKKINIKEVSTFYCKIFGTKIKNDNGYLVKNCQKIHTYFNKTEVDIIGLNDENQVIYIYRMAPKNKVIKINHDDNKTHILVLPKNMSKKIYIGSVLQFE